VWQDRALQVVRLPAHAQCGIGIDGVMMTLLFGLLALLSDGDMASRMFWALFWPVLMML
jgi:hypothetical protein